MRAYRENSVAVPARAGMPTPNLSSASTGELCGLGQPRSRWRPYVDRGEYLQRSEPLGRFPSDALATAGVVTLRLIKSDQGCGGQLHRLVSDRDARNRITSEATGSDAASTINPRSPGWRNRQLPQLITATRMTNNGSVQKIDSSRRYRR